MNKRIVRNLIAIVFALSFSIGMSEYCNAQTKEDIEALELMISATNQMLPQDYGNGMVNTKVVKEGNYLVYYYMCEEPGFDIDRMSNNIPMMKNAIMAEVNSSDYFMTELRRTCKNAGVGIGYYYVGKSSGKVAKVLIPVKELK